MINVSRTRENQIFSRRNEYDTQTDASPAWTEESEREDEQVPYPEQNVSKITERVLKSSFHSDERTGRVTVDSAGRQWTRLDP